MWLHCLELFPAAALRKRNFGPEKSFDAAEAHSINAKVTLPCQTGLAWVQLLPHQLSLNSKIVFNLSELDGSQKFVKNVFIH